MQKCYLNITDCSFSGQKSLRGSRFTLSFEITKRLRERERERERRRENDFQHSGCQALGCDPSETRNKQGNPYDCPILVAGESFQGTPGRAQRVPWVQEMEPRVCCVPAWENMKKKTNRIREKYKEFNNSTIAGGFNTSLSAVDETSKQKTIRKQKTWTTQAN